MAARRSFTVADVFSRRAKTLEKALVAAVVVAATVAVTDLIFIAGDHAPSEFSPASVPGTNIDLIILVPGAIIAIVAGLSWLDWQYVLARVTSPRLRRRRPFWHVACWLIPIVNWWMPLQNIRALWCAHNSESGGRILGYWWAFWVVATFPVLPGDVDQSLAGADPWVDLLCEIAMVVAGILALQMVRQLTRSALAPLRG